MANIKLRQLNADRRYKLTEKQIKKIKNLKGTGKTQEQVAEKFGISRQRVQMLWKSEKEVKEIHRADARKEILRYRTDEEFRKRHNEQNKASYRHRRTVLQTLKTKS